jgi:DnaJ domain
MGDGVTESKEEPTLKKQDELSTYYDRLGLHPSASVQQIRRAYWDLSKLYHPDTTTLPQITATNKFRDLNEAYATLSSPERRLHYDLKIGYSRITVVQAPTNLGTPVSSRSMSSSAYLDPTDRPLSAGEVFALFILALTFIACLVLAITLSLTQGEAAIQSLPSPLKRETLKVEVSSQAETQRAVLQKPPECNAYATPTC